MTTEPPPAALIGSIKELIVACADLPLNAREIADDADMFEQCGIDSVSLVKLVLRLEQRFGITLADEELTPELLETPTSLARLVVSKISRRSEEDSSAAALEAR